MGAWWCGVEDGMENVSRGGDGMWNGKTVGGKAVWCNGGTGINDVEKNI